MVNADEGEPGTIKDRFVMELRPHLFLEGVLIAMTFAEATEGLIYLREEYAAARNRLLQGIDELRAAGLLEGRSLALVIGAGAYIAGEETAMLESMEGRRAMPRLRPPFPLRSDTSAARRSSTTWKPSRTSRPSFETAASGGPGSGRAARRARDSGRSRARSANQAATRRRTA